MKKASVSEAKNNLSALLDRVKTGASVLIVDRGRPVARLEAVTDTTSGDERLIRLTRAGIIRPGRGPLPESVLKSVPPKPVSTTTSILQALLEERRHGR